MSVASNPALKLDSTFSLHLSHSHFLSLSLSSLSFPLALFLSLSLYSNNIHSSIPSQLFNATSLHNIFLYSNNLSGPPRSAPSHGSKTSFLSNNSISGQIPDEFNKCKQLQKLIFAQNKLSNEIPVSILSEMENLVQLDLSSNELSGLIPDDISDLKSLFGTCQNHSANCREPAKVAQQTAGDSELQSPAKQSQRRDSRAGFRTNT